ncbi:MAG: sigma-70 family RNA polymerase sigma factor [Terriglobales bacterium]|jgi:RNA polymerase sigma factor (TIGR02999 family)
MKFGPEDVTALLSEMEKGNQEAASKLVPLVYDELRRIAERYMRLERADHTLQATALVHEAYLKLVRQPSKHFQGRMHFFAIAANTMRHILIDHARRRNAQKRAGNHKVALEEVFNVSAAFALNRAADSDQSEELLKLDSALKKLATLDPRQVKIVELRFFGGLTVEETADIVGISPRQVKREWSHARAWLHGELESSRHGDLA